jgi:hypothetical protein
VFIVFHPRALPHGNELIPGTHGFVPKFDASATDASHWRTICA